MDARNHNRAPSSDVECQRCAARVPLDPGRMRLTITHAALQCPECGTWLRVRRSDAYRDIDTRVAWSFASYSEEPLEDEPEQEHRTSALARLRRRVVLGRQD